MNHRLMRSRQFRIMKLALISALLGSIALAVGSPWVTRGYAAPQLGRSQRQDEFERELAYRRKVELNKKRQQDIKQDTAKLVELTTDLKTLAGKSDDSLFSSDAARKTEQVEKLARKIKDNMKEVLAPPEPATPNPTPRFPR